MLKIMISSILMIIIIAIINGVNCYNLSKFIVKSKKVSILFCKDNDDNEIIGDSRKGKERRALRAIANRKKQDLSLLTLPCSVSYNENFIKNINESLEAKELILLRFHDIEKKKEVKQIMVDICSKSKSEIIQVVGHTALIYKEKEKNSSIKKLLIDELERTKENK